MQMPSKDASVVHWLQYFETRHKEPIRLGLEHVRAVAERLELLPMSARVITVAGTNGKGSAVASLATIYTAAGFQVGTYTSPHLLRFNERIQLNQTPITDKDLVDALQVINACPGSDVLTYFEVATLASLWYFKHTSPDVILLEVGMGGRLDATNIVDSDLAVITTIALDHEAWLGDTREAIAVEKAGIFRNEKPVVVADTNPPNTLIEEAQKRHCKLFISGTAYTFESCEDVFLWKADDVVLRLPLPDINPHAFAAASMVTHVLRHVLPINEQAYMHAARHVHIMGRQQWVSTSHAPVFLDVAHNPQAAMLLAEKFQALKIEGRVHAIFSALDDKNLDGIMKPMRALVDVWYLTCLDDTRGTDALRLKATYERVMQQPAATVFQAPKQAYLAAINEVKPGDVLLVYGSFLLVSAVMLSCLNGGEKGELTN